MTLAARFVPLALLTLACGGGRANDDATDGDRGDDGATFDASAFAPDAAPSAIDALALPPDATPVDPTEAWGAAGTGCPRAPAALGAGTTSTSSEFATHWNGDVSAYASDAGGDTTTARSASAFSITPGFSAHVTPGVDEPEPLLLALAPGRTVVPINRMLGEAYVPARRVCVEGARVVSGFAGEAMTVYADDLSSDSHTTAPHVAVVVGHGRRVILTYAVGATLHNPDDLPLTVLFENIQGFRQVALGDGPDVYVTTQNSKELVDVTLVADRR